jgi:anti-sigma B factor antagonist
MSETHGSNRRRRQDFGNVTVLRLKIQEILDDAIINAMFDPINMLSVIGRNQLVLNLGAVDCVTSMTLANLIELNRKVEAANGRLTLCELTPTVDEILESTRLKALFNVYATEAEALKSFGSEMLA